MTDFWLAIERGLSVVTTMPSEQSVWQVGFSWPMVSSLPLLGFGIATSARQIRQLAGIDMDGW